MERVAYLCAGRCQVGSVTGLTESGSVRSSIPDTLDTPLTPPASVSLCPCCVCLCGLHPPRSTSNDGGMGLYGVAGGVQMTSNQTSGL